MKKFLMIMLMLLCAVGMHAESQWYRTTSFAYASINQYTGRYTWSNWERSDIKIQLNLTTDVITIYSPSTQYYKVYEYVPAYKDNDGGTTVKYYVIDGDGDKGNVRLRIDRNGNSQLYVDFADVAWVYTVIRIA